MSTQYVSTSLPIKRVYLAGPMSWIPQFNIPAFDAAAADLRDRGLEVISPAELDKPEVREIALRSLTGEPSQVTRIESWGSMLARDIIYVADKVESVVVLPGWDRSRGACLETYVAYLTQKPVLAYPDLLMVDFSLLRTAWTTIAPLPASALGGPQHG